MLVSQEEIEEKEKVVYTVQYSIDHRWRVNPNYLRGLYINF